MMTTKSNNKKPKKSLSEFSGKWKGNKKKMNEIFDAIAKRRKNVQETQNILPE